MEIREYINGCGVGHWQDIDGDAGDVAAEMGWLAIDGADHGVHEAPNGVTYEWRAAAPNKGERKCTS